METSVEIQMRPIWVDRGDYRACYIVEQVDVNKHLFGRTFRKVIENIPYKIRFEKEYISIREDKPVLCDFTIKITKGNKHQKDRMETGLKILCEFSKEIQKTVIEQQKEYEEWLPQDILVFCI